jgi:hypothetical protein
MTDTTIASRNEATAASPTLLTDNEIDAVGGGGVWSILLKLVQRDCP